MSLRYVETRPPAALASHVKCIWWLTGRGIDGAPEPVVPDGCAEIVINTADAFERRDGAACDLQPRELVAGQLTRAVQLKAVGEVGLVGIRLQPWALGALFGRRGSDVRNQTIDLSLLAPRFRTDLLAAVHSRRPSIRLAALFRAVDAQRRRVRSDSRTAANLVVLAASLRSPSVTALARSAGLTARRVQMVFRDEVGLSPKQLLRIWRFQRALQLARASDRRAWAEIAARAGYYDQAHLLRDSSMLLGTTPARLLGALGRLTDSFLPAASDSLGSST